MKIEEKLTFEKVKDKIIFRIVGENKLNEYREKDGGNLLYRLMGHDMYMIYVIEMEQGFSIVFTDILLNKLGCDEETVIRLAKKNTEIKYPPVLRNVENAIFETIKKDKLTEDDLTDDSLLNSQYSSNLLETEHMTLSPAEGDQMHVLTNTSTRYGAGVIFYEGLLKKISKIFGDDLFLIPSSVHEFILLPRYANISEDDLNFILNDVNAAFVSNEEILGENVMIYDAKRGKIL